MFTRITKITAVNAFIMAGGNQELGLPLIDLISELQLTGVPLPEVLVGIAEQITADVFEVTGTTVRMGPNYE